MGFSQLQRMITRNLDRNQVDNKIELGLGGEILSFR